MSSEKNKELFLEQVKQILDGIKQDRDKVLQSWFVTTCTNYVYNTPQSPYTYRYACTQTFNCGA